MITAAKIGWLKDIKVFMTPVAHTNWNTNVVNTSAVYNGWAASSGAQNAERDYYHPFVTPATYDIEVMYVKGTDHGIITLYIDGVSIGTIDTYNGSTTYNNKTVISGVTVATSGKKTLKLKMATKNASATSYYGRIQHIQIRRTA